MQFTRRFWIAASCTLSVLFGSSFAQAQQTKVLPNDTEMIITINLAQILKSDVVKANKAIVEVVKAKVTEALDDKEISKYLKKADFDLFRDLHSITFAIPGGNRTPQDGFILLEGSFDADKIEAAATEASNDKGGGLKVARIGNLKAFEISPQGEKTIYIGVLSKKVMIAASSKADFADAAARLSGTKQSAMKAEVKALMGTVNNKQSLSVIATSGAVAKLADLAPEGAGGQAKKAMAMMKDVDGFSIAVTIQKNIDLQLGVNMKDKDAAATSAFAVNAGVALFKGQFQQKAKEDKKFETAVEVLNSIRATAQGSNLMIRGQISFETLEKILQNLPIPGN